MQSVARHEQEQVQRPEHAQGHGDIRFANLLGKVAWAALPAAVRRRFGTRLSAGQSVVYRGQIIETRMSRLGTFLAQMLRPLGAPLPFENHVGGAPAIVTVTEAAHGRGQYWTRQYNRKAGFPQVIHSMKSFTGPTGLEEEIGHGIGMTLAMKTAGNSLMFHSMAYFMTLFGRRIALPKPLTPGRLVVGHHDLGDGAFDFTLDLIHPAFGELLHQRVRFYDREVWT